MLKKKWLIRGIILFMILAAVFGAAAYIDRAYHVEDVQVDGNVHYTAEEIKNIVMSGHFGDNSLYLSWKYRNRDIKGSFCGCHGGGDRRTPCHQDPCEGKETDRVCEMHGHLYLL